MAEARAPGRPPVRSAAITPGDRDREFPPIVLRRLRTIEGRIVDRQGRPVAGALVFQSGDGPMRTEALADQDGRFALPGVFEGPAIVLARKDGFRPTSSRSTTAGRRSGSSWPATDEAPIAAYKTLPPALPADEEKALARRLVQAEAGRVLARGDDQAKFVFLTNLAALDPADALERLEAARFADPGDADSIRSAAAEALARENLDEGLAVVEALKTPEQRAHGYLAVLRAQPDLEPARARQIIDQAIVNARSPSNEWHEDLPAGTDRRPAARPGRDRAGEAPDPRGRGAGTEDAPGQDAREPARELRRPDAPGQPAAALPKFEELRRQIDGGQVTVRALASMRHYEQAAYHLAAQSGRGRALAAPALVHPGAPANTCVVAVCARMAPADLPRARRLVDLITEDERVLKAYALGLMAGAIASDRPSALKLLDDAYAELESLVDRGWTSQFASISGVAGRLLPVVEQVDASRLPEYLARALALRSPAGGRNNQAFIPEQPASLAMSVARYDRDLAARLLRPELDALDAAPSPTTLVGYPRANREGAARMLVALALIDPRQAVERTERLRGDEGTGSSAQDRRFRVARLLATRGPERWRRIDERELILWDPAQGVR